MLGKLEDLRALIARRDVVVIVGAGVSLQATDGEPVAGWRGFLESGITHCSKFVPGLPADWAERKHRDLDGDLDEWLAVASQIEKKLGGRNEPVGGEYRRWLAETVGQLQIKDQLVLEALRDLDVPIATTNYDSLLTEVTGRPPVTWRDSSRVQRVLRGDEDGILHLHGHWQEPESVVLGISSYEAVLGSAAAQALQQALRMTTSLLYVGYGTGLEDPNFGALFAWARATFGGSETYRHYRLAREHDVAAVQAMHPSEDRLFVVSFGAGRSDLAPFLQGLASARTATPPPVSVSLTSPRLPGRMGFCFGRNDVVDLLVQHLLTSTPAPVPILGGPGMGKSTVTLEALHHPEVAKKFGDRRFFVRCDGTNTAAALVTEVARSLGLTETAGGDLSTRVLTELSREPAVLALDNAETPWEGELTATEALLAQFGDVPALVILASFRGARRPFGPRWRTSVEIGRLDPVAAREAFLAVAGARFATDPALDALLIVLDGVPLAITLLASAAEAAPDLAWVRERWQEERTKLLKRGASRLEDIGASIEISLTGQRMKDQAPAQQLLSLLGLLPAGAALSDLPELLPYEARTAAETLVAVGLAFYEGSRLRLLAPIREYVADRYPPGEEDRKRLERFFLELVRSQSERMGVGVEGGQEAVVRLAPELDNLERVFDMSLSSPDLTSVSHGNTEQVRLLSSIMQILMLGISPIILPALNRRTELVRSRVLEDPKILERITKKIAKKVEAEEDPRLQAKSIQSLGEIALTRSNYQEARSYYETALSLYEQVGDLLGKANCIQRLGDIVLARSDLQEARSYYETALSLYEQVGDLLGKANCIQRLGDIVLSQSDLREARLRYEIALSLFQKADSILGEANCIQSLGDIAFYRLDHLEARSRYETARQLFQRVGSLLGEANCIHRLGDIAFARLDYQKARSHYETALPLFHEWGSLLGEANCFKRLGDIAFAQGAPARALERFTQALDLYVRFGDAYSIGRTRVRLARLTDGDARREHVEAARQAWTSIDRVDLVRQLNADFPDCNGPLISDHGLR